MPQIQQTNVFTDWLEALRDERARQRIISRTLRLAAGNAGTVRSVGERVSELKIDYGPGYRVYFTRRGLDIVILLCGGDKSGQTRDIAAAKKVLQVIDERNLYGT